MKKNTSIHPDKIRSSIITSAKAILYVHGPKSVTIEAVCDLEGIDEETLLSKFKDLEQLFTEIANQGINNGRAAFVSVMEKKISFQEKIAELLALQLEELRNLSETYLKEILNDDSSNLTLPLSILNQANINTLEQEIRSAQLRGELGVTVDSAKISEMLSELPYRLKNPSVSQLNASKKDLIIDLTSFIFLGILRK